MLVEELINFSKMYLAFHTTGTELIVTDAIHVCVWFGFCIGLYNFAVILRVTKCIYILVYSGFFAPIRSPNYHTEESGMSTWGILLVIWFERR